MKTMAHLLAKTTLQTTNSEILPSHPARYTKKIVERGAYFLKKYKATEVIDIFAGTGERIAALRDHGWSGVIHANEKQKKWAIQAPSNVLMTVGDSACLDALQDVRTGESVIHFDNCFHAAFTSVVYGNRMCLPAGTLISTWSGFKPIEMITPGELVLTHQGRWMPVTWAGETGEEPVIELIGKGATSLKCTASHRILIRSKNRVRTPVRLGPTKWASANSTERSYWGIPARNTKVPDGATVPDVPSIAENKEAFWWFVGFWLANGWAYRRPCGEKWTHAYVGLSKFIDHALYAEHGLMLAFGKRLKIGGTENNQQFWTVYSQELIAWLYEHFGHLSHGKIVPGWTLTLPESMRRAVLEGWLYGDGCIADRDRDRETRVGVSINRALLRGMQMLAHSLGFSTSLGHTKTARQELVCGKLCWVRDSWSLKVIAGKTRRLHNYDGVDWCQIREVRESDGVKVPVYDLTISEDSSFVAEGVIVHNSDSHRARDKSKRNTYTHQYGEPLEEGNIGKMQFTGKRKSSLKYCTKTKACYIELRRILSNKAIFILNVSDHIRKGKRVRATLWHRLALQSLGFEVIEEERIHTPRLREGANHEKRVAYESIIVFRLNK